MKNQKKKIDRESFLQSFPRFFENFSFLAPSEISSFRFSVETDLIVS